jgi:hypothetical protein
MEELNVCPSWLTFNPNHGILGPTEKHSITVTININLLTANEFISNYTKVLLIHIFININTKFLLILLILCRLLTKL